ncbi:MAG: hypothetical protein WAO74_08765 [Polaribacter sp.]|uniref:alpha/beta hydrolase family protein n=1 Tax=Polaribacter sp. TaxID=1920175 RepID=UPI003BAE42FE
MMRTIYTLLILMFSFQTYAQNPEKFGFKHLQYIIEADTVDVLIKSKKGDENKKKPLLFSVQGSLGVPLIIHNGTHRVKYSTLEEGFVENEYHLVIVNKPGIPLIAHIDSLVDGKEYFINKKEYIYPTKYLKNNNLDYYVKRNLQVIDSLFKENWVDTSKLVISGHSQGSGIALSMCDKTIKATHLIYSSGLPYYSTILAMLHKERMKEANEQNPRVEKIIRYWKEAVEDPFNYINPNRDSNLTLSSFSQNENIILKRLSIPVLISYGTKDESSPYQDMFRIETIKDRIKHITFNDYIGLGHNYQLVNPDKENQKTDFLSEVLFDWLQWIKDN